MTHYFFMIPKTYRLLITASSMKPFEGQVSKFLKLAGYPCHSPGVFSPLVAYCDRPSEYKYISTPFLANLLAH
jgi:hypothetical protein